MSKGFTLLEFLIVMAIIGILLATVLIFLKPQEIFKKNRDFQRTTDMQVLKSTIDIFKQEGPTTYIGEAKKIYLSLPDVDSNCSSWLNQLSPLPNGYQYVCSSNPENTNGTGWIPIDFTKTNITTITALPVDPINSPPYYYTYMVGGSFEISAYLEFNASRNVSGTGGKDNGTSWNIYEVGSNLKLIPFSVEDGMGRELNLRAYWSFDEATGTLVYDASLNKSNGTIYGGAPWQNGKSRSGLKLDNESSANDYVQVSHNSSLNFSNKMTISAWMNPIDRNQFDTSQTLINKEGSYEIMLSGDTSPKIWWALMGTSPHGWNVNLSTTTLARGNWYNVVFVYNGQNVKIYVNGQLRYTTNEAGNISDNQNKALRIGYRFDDPTAYFNGIVDEIRIYDRELNIDEIQQLYNAAQ